MASAVITAIVALIVVLLTGRLNSDRAHDDRVWARKADAYSAIFAALGDLQESYDAWLMEEIAHKDEPSEAEADERRARAKAARELVFGTLNREIWVLPKAVAEQINKLGHSLSDERHDSWFDAVDARSGAIRKVTKELVVIATRDMNRPKLLDGRPSPPPPTT